VRASIALVLAVAGCSGFIDKQAASSTYRILGKSVEASRRQADLELARAAVPGGLIQLETFALAYPDHRGFRVLHADALCQFGLAFVFDDWEDAQLAGRTDEATAIATRLDGLLASCVDANLALLPPAYRDAHARGELASLLPSATVAHARPLIWIASVLAVRIAIEPAAHLGSLPTAIAMLARTAELAPGAHDAQGEIMLGTLEAARARFVAGPDGSARFAAARRALGDGALIVDVMYARAIAVAKQDRALFTSTLERVLVADLARWPERRLSNELARRKARRYLAAADALIP
jgi:hypothetical protein